MIDMHARCAPRCATGFWPLPIRFGCCRRRAWIGPLQRCSLAFSFFAAACITACSSEGVPQAPSGTRAVVQGAKLARPFKVLHAFKDAKDGAEPYAGLLSDGGVLYGTTYRGGDANDGGTVYKITPSGGYSIIHRFVRHAPFGRRANPDGGLVSDSAGNLYGTTLEGGPMHRGTVYKVSAHGRVTTLYTFTGPDGDFPYAGLLRDAAGNLYGTTQAGGIYLTVRVEGAERSSRLILPTTSLCSMLLPAASPMGTTPMVA